MAEVGEAEVRKVVAEVLDRLQKEGLISGGGETSLAASPAVRGPSSRPAGGPVFSTVDEAVEAAESAQRAFQEMGLEMRRKIIQSIREAGIRNAERLAKMAHEETGLGRWEHKVQKNLLVSNKTPGVEDLQPVIAYTGDKGLTLVEWAPFGVVASVTPSTNPTSTVLNNSISILSAGNAAVFAPHPGAIRCSQETIRLVDEAVRASGGPACLVTTFEPVTHETTTALLGHPKIRCSMVTGGPSIVSVAMKVGKPQKLICAGPGNPPVIVDEYAEFPKCASDIVDGASFDNCILCTGEKETIVTEAAWDKFLAAMRAEPRAYELSSEQMDRLASVVILPTAGAAGGGQKEARLNREFIGKNAALIAEKALGLRVPEKTMLLWGIVPNNHPFIWTEQLMPVMPVTRVRDIDAAVDLASAAEGGNHHTASIYSLHVGNITKAARALACSIFVKNGPTFMGLGVGEGYASMSIGTPTGDGMTKPRHFARPLHCTLVGYFRIA